MALHHFPVTWDQFHRDARTLGLRLLESGNFTGIIAISRGGLIPAAIVARELEIRWVETVSIVTYQDEVRGEPIVTKPPAAAGNGSGFLLIDDLVDTGATARVARALLPKAIFACVYAKPAGRALVDCFVTEVPQDTWILFPWDMAPHYVPPLIRRGEG